jgi:hypothetical protein
MGPLLRRWGAYKCCWSQPLTPRLLKVKVILRPTVTRPVCLNGRHPSGAHGKFLLLSVVGFLTWGVISNEKTCLQFTSVAGPCQRSHSRGLSPARLMTIFYCLRFETPKTSKSKSKLFCDWQSVNQYVLVSSPLWDLWPDAAFLWNVGIWMLLSCILLGALSDERSGLSFTWKVRSVFISQKQGGPVIPRGTGFWTNHYRIYPIGTFLI